MSEPVERRGARPPRRSRKALACVGAIVAGAHGAAAGAPPPRLIAQTAPPLALAAPLAPAEGTENGAQAVEIP